jgi:hypothetical protein
MRLDTAVYATCETGDGDTITFRVGQPTTHNAAHARYARLWEAGAIDHGQCRPLARARVRHQRRWYRVRFMEVRSTDRHGRGLGSERHSQAIPVPYVKVRKVGK